jgi:hypothetical protein
MNLKGIVLKPIEGFEGKYSITSDGRVLSHIKGRFMVYSTNWLGYKAVTLQLSGKARYRYVHRLVAQAFIDKPEDKNEVNHIDGDKTNNSIENLEWTSRSENIKKAYETGLIPRNKGKSKNGVIKERRVYKPGDDTKFYIARQGVVSE